VRILKKPEPAYTDKARKAGVEGTVVLQAVFSSDATLNRIRILQWLPFGLTERAVEAARGIKFTPATKDGRPVSMFYRIEYNFHLY
jgi:protein TonB